MRYTEHDEDRFVRVRASVIDDGERRIKELEAELAKVNENRAEMFKEMCEDDETIIHLRSCLKRLEWTTFNDCPVCKIHRKTGHDPDCWLAKELEGK